LEIKAMSKQCRFCGQEIHDAAKVCPHCRKRQGMSPLAFWLIIVAVGIIGVGAAVCIGLVTIGRYAYQNTLEDAKKDSAKAQLTVLTTACKAYKIKTGQYPAQLSDLSKQTADGYGPFSSDDDLVDPWNRPYLYDPSGQRNNGMQPDISTVSPSGETIGNWPKNR
jgi:hypothetical protein